MRKGFWFDRAPAGETFGKYEYTWEEIVFDPLPCWSHLPVEEQRRRVAALVEEIEEEARIRREAAGIKPLGLKAILAQNSTRRPKKLKKSPAPFVHAASKAMRRELWEAYATFVAAYRAAADHAASGIAPSAVVLTPSDSPPPAARNRLNGASCFSAFRQGVCPGRDYREITGLFVARWPRSGHRARPRFFQDWCNERNGCSPIKTVQTAHRKLRGRNAGLRKDVP